MKEGYLLLEQIGEEISPPRAISLCGKAIETFRRAREAASEDEEGVKIARLGLAEAYSQRGHQYRFARSFREALADLSQAVRLNPDLHEDFYYRALTYLKLGDQKQARADFSQFLRYGQDEYLRQEAENRLKTLMPGDNNAREQVAFLSQEGTRLNAEAAGLMQPREGQSSQPDRAITIYNRALENFQKALELAPKDVLAKMGTLAALSEQTECYMAIEEYDLAVQNLTRAMSLNSNPVYLFRRGEAYRKIGQRELAKEDFNEFLNRSNDGGMKEQARQYLGEKPTGGSVRS